MWVGAGRPHAHLWGLGPSTAGRSEMGPHTFIHAPPFHIFPVPVALAVAKPGWPLGHVVGHQGAPTSPTHLALVRQKSDAGTAQPPWKVEAPGHWRTQGSWGDGVGGQQGGLGLNSNRRSLLPLMLEG